jgi:hypothetical protein
MQDELPPRDAALAIATRALRLCLSGEGEAGLAEYRAIARRGTFQRLPLGLHIHMMREAGRDAEADAVTALTLRWGGDLAWRALRTEATPRVAAEEYEAWIVRASPRRR